MFADSSFVDALQRSDQERLEENLGKEKADEVIKFFHKFRNSLENNNRQVVADMIRYPQTFLAARGNNPLYKLEIYNSSELLKNYDSIFTSTNKNILLNLTLNQECISYHHELNCGNKFQPATQISIETTCDNDESIKNCHDYTIRVNKLFVSELN